MDKAALYRTVWRWHFYASLFVIPLVLILSVTGATYLFRPQVERWEERAWQNLPTANAVSPDHQVQAALGAYPGSKLHTYRLPEMEGDAALVHIGLAGSGPAMRDVFVSPQGEVLGALDPELRIMKIVQRIHGQLLLGKPGSWLVELAASWAIAMILTGLYLWWPRQRGFAGVLWPRLSSGPKAAWRDMHAVSGFWVSGLALLLLLTGLPWADVWGSAFKTIRAEMGWVEGKQDWAIGGGTPDADGHAGHDHAAMLASQSAMPGVIRLRTMSLTDMAGIARRENLAFPVLIAPPGAPGRFGRKGADNWTVRSESANRPLRTTISYDGTSGMEVSRETFADGHPIDRVVGYGVAWHEGQLLGWINQLIGLLTAVMLVTVSVTGFVMWRRRKPREGIGPPPRAADRKIARLLPAAIGLAIFLPLLAASLLIMVMFDCLILPRLPRLAAWLGMQALKSS